MVPKWSDAKDTYPFDGRGVQFDVKMSQVREFA